MRKNEYITNKWVDKLLERAGLDKLFYPQGSNIKEINDALATASKKGNGERGYPEYTGVVGDFLFVIENKTTINNHIKRDEQNKIALDTKSTVNYAVNGALHYGKHLVKNTNYKRIFALAVSGDEHNYRITPLFINRNGDYKQLPDIENFTSFKIDNINTYYQQQVLNIKFNNQLTTEEVLKVARSLHEDLRNYGSLQDKDKPLIVSGILLALSEIEHKSFNIEDLNGDRIRTDGQKIYKAIEDHLSRANVSPEVKKKKLLNYFTIIQNNTKINQINPNLGKTPLKYFTEILYNKIFANIKYNSSAEDYIGRFYGEFMSYSGGDGQTLGIILTPKHITDLFCDLVDLKPTDKVLDPCTGTGGFLIAAMHRMLQNAENELEKEEIKKNRLFGIELQDYMFTIATTNMILRGDGKSNLKNQDFLAQDANKLQLQGCTVGMMNPPYSQGSDQNPNLYEMSFIDHLLESMVKGSKVVVIVPQSTFTGKTRHEQNLKTKILKKHTLEGVITLNKNTFYGVGTNTCIGIFTAGRPHLADKKVKFINFENDGFVVHKHVGLVDDGSVAEKKQYLLDVWNNKVQAPTSFCVETTIKDTDEWLYSFYYFNDEIPSDEEFEKTIADYLTFQVNMITHGRGYLFDSKKEFTQESKPTTEVAKSHQKQGIEDDK